MADFLCALACSQLVTHAESATDEEEGEGEAAAEEGAEKKE